MFNKTLKVIAFRVLSYLTAFIYFHFLQANKSDAEIKVPPPLAGEVRWGGVPPLAPPVDRGRTMRNISFYRKSL